MFSIQGFFSILRWPAFHIFTFFSGKNMGGYLKQNSRLVFYIYVLCKIFPIGSSLIIIPSKVFCELFLLCHGAIFFVGEDFQKAHFVCCEIWMVDGR